MSEKKPEEVSFDEACYRLHIMERELAYHRAAHDAAGVGLDDCYEIHYDSGDELDDEGRSHISAWSQRVAMSAMAIAEVSGQVAQAAQLVAELTRGAPVGTTLS